MTTLHWILIGIWGIGVVAGYAIHSYRYGAGKISYDSMEGEIGPAAIFFWPVVLAFAAGFVICAGIVWLVYQPFKPFYLWGKRSREKK